MMRDNTPDQNNLRHAGQVWITNKTRPNKPHDSTENVRQNVQQTIRLSSENLTQIDINCLSEFPTQHSVFLSICISLFKNIQFENKEHDKNVM